MKITFKHFSACLYIIFSSVILCGCKKFVTADPPKTQLLSNNVFASDATANSAVAGMYSYMYQINNTVSTYGGYHLTICTGLSADELSRPAFPTDLFYTNNLSPSNSDIEKIWSSSYSIIYNANAIIEGLQQSSGVSTVMKTQLTGEALFIRAFCHFYLVNLFGDVPLITTTNVNQTGMIGRVPKDSIYRRIVADLEQAKNMLANDYSFSNNERVRVNKWVATAFLGRVYLYAEDWTNAEAQSTAVISNTGLYTLLSDLNTVFLKNSNEAIWQLLSFAGLGYTTVGSQLLPASYSVVPTYTLSDFQLNAFSSADQRKTAWTYSYLLSGQTFVIPYKYRQKTTTSSSAGEYDMVLRLAEQYLIRAEARAQLNNVSGSQTDLNMIRRRAGLGNALANDKSSLLLAIEHERQTEFFAEWGHRWLDLKRTGRISTVITGEKPGWTATKALYPVPSGELSNNPALTQNAGY